MNVIPEDEKIRIIITGDFCPVGRIENICLEEKYSEIYNDVLPILTDKDIAITNLECPLTTSKKGIHKIGPVLSADPKCICGIKFGNFDIVTLSNNHIMDFDECGLDETIKSCNDEGIKFVGAGRNLDDASRPLYINVKSKIIAIINITENEFSIATEHKAGANPLNLIKNYNQIIEAKKKSDYLLLILHGGNEYYNLPSPQMVERCHFFADLGVNAIVCHHTHCPSGYEIYNGTPIFYGLGNFIFDIKKMKPDDWYKGYFVNFTLNNNSFSIYPYFQNKNEIGLRLMPEKENRKFLDYIVMQSTIIKNESLLIQKWYEYIRGKEYSYLSSLFSLNKFERIFYKNGIFKSKIINNKKIMSMYNRISCEAHKEVLLTILRDRF